MKQSPARPAVRPGANLPPAQLQAVQRAIDARRTLPGALLPILHAVQDALGHVPPDAIPLIAHELNLTRADVHGVVSFYHHFRSTPPGRHIVQICRAEACQSLGADALGAHVRNRLEVDWHGTTHDGAVTLEPVFCLGLCAVGPSALLDGRPLGRLDPARIDAELGDAA